MRLSALLLSPPQNPLRTVKLQVSTHILRRSRAGLIGIPDRQILALKSSRKFLDAVSLFHLITALVWLEVGVDSSACLLCFRTNTSEAANLCRLQSWAEVKEEVGYLHAATGCTIPAHPSSLWSCCNFTEPLRAERSHSVLFPPFHWVQAYVWLFGAVCLALSVSHFPRPSYQDNKEGWEESARM